ncbi:tetratricopeptide repeat-containing sulfotransferase family protein [Microbulbifer sediminum]|uniref:tetratricopeptide repeat-containing sulfotransferase family protein n=1 Tax=Microbulbifer sediminum TaxID=2904250 RepID=UPI001F3247D3|nr:sulfotransferase [Microbulbifer sediminum]
MPDTDIAARLQQVRDAVQRRDWRTATRLSIEVLQRDPDQPDAHLVLGLAAAEGGKPGMALKAFDRVLQLDPGRHDARAQSARCLVQAGRHREAEQEADRCAPELADSAKLLDLVATVYSHIGKQDKAAPLFRRAAALAPADMAILSNAASVEVFLGEKERARAYLEQALQQDPGHYRSHWQLSKIHRATDRGHIEAMEKLVSGLGTNHPGRPFLHYAIGKEYEDLQDWNSAWTHYHAGAEAQRRRIGYAPAADRTLFKTLRRGFDRDWLDSTDRATTADNDATPIFIVGLPRSGSTLVEQILGSHSQVQPLGELHQWPLAVKRSCGVAVSGLVNAEIAAAAAGINPAEAADTYLESIRHLRGDEPCFTDKLPGNFLYLGLLARAFPQARFVHVHRNPMDSCFAIYKQLFADAYPYSYRLDELADYYVEYRRLMDHWQALLGNRLYNVDYDVLVVDQHRQTEQLLDYLGLPFEEACLQFHRSAAAAATASAAQVRQPLHARSVGRWRKFAGQLAPLRQKLEQAGLSLD